jgi:hypothetical protein
VEKITFFSYDMEVVEDKQAQIGKNMNSNPKSKKSSGKPRSYEEVKVTRSFSLSPTGVSGIVEKSNALGLSASEYIDRHGRGVSLRENPIQFRIKLFLEAPISGWWCLSESLRRSALQLGVVSFSNSVKLQEVLIDTLKRTVAILAMISYAVPDLYFDDLCPVMRYISYKLLLGKSSLLNEYKTKPKINDKLIKEGSRKIRQALSYLQQQPHSYPSFAALRMEFIDCLTFQQVVRYNLVHSVKANAVEEEVRKNARDAIFLLRSYIHRGFAEESAASKEFDHPENKDQEYYNMCALKSLSQEDANKMEKFLYDAMNDHCLDFWIREIDHIAGHQLIGFNSVHNNNEHHDIHHDILNILSEEIEEYIQEKQYEMEKGFLRDATSFSKIKDGLQKVIQEESNNVLTLEDIPMPSLRLEKGGFWR